MPNNWGTWTATTVSGTWTGNAMPYRRFVLRSTQVWVDPETGDDAFYSLLLPFWEEEMEVAEFFEEFYLGVSTEESPRVPESRSRGPPAEMDR